MIYTDWQTDTEFVNVWWSLIFNLSWIEFLGRYSANWKNISAVRHVREDLYDFFCVHTCITEFFKFWFAFLTNDSGSEIENKFNGHIWETIYERPNIKNLNGRFCVASTEWNRMRCIFVRALGNAYIGTDANNLATFKVNHQKKRQLRMICGGRTQIRPPMSILRILTRCFRWNLEKVWNGLL